jgi:MFS transporter, SP family, general alpha glucoside:H+ symporter
MGAIDDDKDLEDPKNGNASIATASVDEINAKARHATELEKKLDFRTAVSLYPTAIGWSVFFSLGIIMTAFDPQLLGNLYAMPAFQKEFGYEYEGKFIISAPW